jgi:flagellar hook-basal body complex protein FliE
MIEAIAAGLTPVNLTNTQAGGATTGAGVSGDGSFGSLVRNAVERLEQGQRHSEQEMARAVAGESPDLHRTVIALQTEELSFQLALQVRNKVIGAYEEIMRMQV